MVTKAFQIIPSLLEATGRKLYSVFFRALFVSIGSEEGMKLD